MSAPHSDAPEAVRLPSDMPHRDDDFLAPAAVADPYPMLAGLRDEAPVHYNTRHGAVVLTRHADVRDAMRNTDLSSDRLGPYVRARRQQLERNGALDAFQLLARWLVFLDPPDHTRIRKLVNRAFTTRQVQRLEPATVDLVDDLLDDLTQGQTIDWVTAFAYPLPVLVISRLLGVPGSDSKLLKGWSDAISGFIFGAEGDPNRHERAHLAVTEMADYFQELVEHYRRNPAENIITDLIEASDDNAKLTPREVVATAMLLLFAGHETTSNLLTNGVHALMEHPAQWERLREDASVATAAVEELLRYDGPSKVVMRLVPQDMTLYGHEMPSGTLIFLTQAAANRDPGVFTDPDALDVTRQDNPHLAFGLGPHFCLGAPLARLEAQLTLQRMVERSVVLQRTSDPVEWQPTLLSRGARRLPVTVSAVSPRPSTT